MCGGPLSLMNYHSESTEISLLFGPGVSIIVNHGGHNYCVRLPSQSLSTEVELRLYT